MSSLYEILPYSIDVVCASINDFTDTPISIIKRKSFIGYLDSYINHFSKEKDDISILIEKKYIDRSYIQDYSDYYVKCFNLYKRDCMRIHFFNCKENELCTVTSFEDSDESKIDSIVKLYLGFIVIRPIPSTFIARACLKRYETPEDKLDHYIISRNVKSHLLGLDLFVETVPFIEQDRVLSVCATSALWSFFNAHSNVDKNQIPSPYQITTTAINMNAMSVVAPDQMDSGLTIDMMCNCLKTLGLVPQFFEIKEENSAFFYELIHVFVSSNIPVILGLTIYDRKPDAELKEKGGKGLHAVVVLGDELCDVVNFKKVDFNFSTKSENLSKLYIHDDRIGPYARLEYKDGNWNLPYDGCISNDVHNTEFYEPTDIVIGLYPKVRLPFATVWNFAYYLNENIKALFDLHPNTNESDAKIAKTGYENILWDFKLENGSDLKRRIRKSDVLSNSKKNFLGMSLPHYCWVVKAHLFSQTIFEVILDSTEVSQGKYVIDVLFYKSASKVLFDNLSDYFEKIIKDDGGNAFSELIQHGLWPLYKWFNPEPDIFSALDFQFGETRIPRYIKSNEYNNDEVKNQKPVVLTSRDDSSLFKLEKDQKYIWTINKDGFLLIGKEDKDDLSEFKGHPTLLQGRPGRIAGELYFDGTKWLVNSKSGRYSFSYSDEDAEHFVRNVIKNRFSIFYPTESFDYQPRHV